MSTSDKSGVARLAKEIGGLYLSNDFSDVTLVIDGTDLPAHRMILSQRCPYFKTMFASRMIESMSKRIELRETPINGFKHVLKWIYTAEIEISQMDTALEVARLSNMYLLTELEKLIMKYVEEFKLNPHGTSFEMFISDKRGVAQLAEEIGELYLKEDFSDVTIVVDGTELPAHRMILSQRCPYFKTMFASSMIESTSERIELRETPINGFKSVLQWIYAGEIEFSQMDTALEVHRLSNMYQLNDLKRTTSSYISNNSNVDNFCMILNRSTSWSPDCSLIYDCLEESGAAVLTHETFLNLSKDSMKLMLEDLPDDLINVEILEAFVRWMKANPDQSEHFPDLLKLISLNSIAFGDLASLVPSELMSANVLMEVAREQQAVNANGQIKDTNFATAKCGAKVTIDNKHVFLSKRYLCEIDDDTNEVVIDLGQPVKLNTFCAYQAIGYSETSRIDISVSTDGVNWTCVVHQRSIDYNFSDYNFVERVVRFIQICGDEPLYEILELDAFAAYYE
uniref:BTB domain-containing protein n=1 Tax=Panagrellus redivivus TaxID=6233 RepID=A0A7E4UTZ6_PANRE